MNEPSVIIKTVLGGYRITTPVPDRDALSTLSFNDYRSTLWGARRAARKQQRQAAKWERDRVFRETLHPNCRSTQPKDI